MLRLTTHHHRVPSSRNLGNINFLEPSGTVQACNGTGFTSVNAIKRPVFVVEISSIYCEVLTGFVRAVRANFNF